MRRYVCGGRGVDIVLGQRRDNEKHYKAVMLHRVMEKINDHDASIMSNGHGVKGKAGRVEPFSTRTRLIRARDIYLSTADICCSLNYPS